MCSRDGGRIRKPDALRGMMFVLMMPLAIVHMTLALWLLAKGFPGVPGVPGRPGAGSHAAHWVKWRIDWTGARRFNPMGEP